MTEGISVDPYDAVLADLRAKRDQIDRMIDQLTAFRSGMAGPGPQGSVKPDLAAQSQPIDPTGMFLGMSIVDATKKLLALRKKAMSNADILADLKAGGLVLTSNDQLNVVSSVLMRRFKTEGDIVRVSRGVWGLKEWYPGRTFKPVTAGRNMSAISGEKPATEQFSELGDNITGAEVGPPDDPLGLKAFAETMLAADSPNQSSSSNQE